MFQLLPFVNELRAGAADAGQRLRRLVNVSLSFSDSDSSVKVAFVDALEPANAPLVTSSSSQMPRVSQ